MRETAADPNNILARLAKLERQNRRQRVALLALVLSFGSMFLGGAMLPQSDATVASTVIAHKFVLVDANGKTRAVLGLNGGYKNRSGQPRLALLDATGKQRAVLWLGSSGNATLGFYRVSDPPSEPGLFLTDSLPWQGLTVDGMGDNFPAVNISVDRNGPSLNIYANGGSSEITLGEAIPFDRMFLVSRVRHHGRYFGLQIGNPNGAHASLGSFHANSSTPRLELWNTSRVDGLVARVPDVGPNIGRVSGTSLMPSITSFVGGRPLRQWR